MSRSLTLLALLAGSSLATAETPHVVSLQTQHKGATTYFVVLVRPPEDLRMPTLEWSALNVLHDGERRRLTRLPQLVPQDENSVAVYCGLDLPMQKGRDQPLRFVGKVRGKEKAQLLLLYPTQKKETGDKKRSLIQSLSGQTWAEVPLTLDFSQATRLTAFEGVRTKAIKPAHEDLEGQ